MIRLVFLSRLILLLFFLLRTSFSFSSEEEVPSSNEKLEIRDSGSVRFLELFIFLREGPVSSVSTCGEEDEFLSTFRFLFLSSCPPSSSSVRDNGGLGEGAEAEEAIIDY